MREIYLCCQVGVQYRICHGHEHGEVAEGQVDPEGRYAEALVDHGPLERGGQHSAKGDHALDGDAHGSHGDATHREFPGGVLSRG